MPMPEQIRRNNREIESRYGALETISVCAAASMVIGSTLAALILLG